GRAPPSPRLSRPPFPPFASTPEADQTAVMSPMRPFGQKRSSDGEVLFSVRYQDGRRASMHVKRATAAHGDNVVLDIAREQQEQGTLPAGTIVSVKRER